jgi:predicted AlkP superfamily pyrophosphatase or phosphodiesterase
MVTALVCTIPASSSSAWEHGQRGVRRVLLLSIDGFHAVDLEICVATGACPHLAKLSEHGLTYTNASATKPSDSFAGLLALVTGGTSKVDRGFLRRQL